MSLRTGQRKKLLRYYRHHLDPSVRSRAHIILLLADGHSWGSIEDMLFCSSRTIDRWRKRFEEGGVDALLGRPAGAQSRWSEEAGAALRNALEHSPDELGYLPVN
jgi:transposase